MDWAASGLPLHGEDKEALVGNFLIRDVPTCTLSERIDEVSRRLEDAGYRYSPVVNDRGIVLGLFRATSTEHKGSAPVEAVMESGPSTLRANASLEQAAAYLSKNDLSEVLVTTGAGELLGILTRQAAEHAVNELGPQK